jgi:serine/threonine protein kinase
VFDSPQWKDFPAQGIKLIEKLLCKDPERRISIEKVLDDPWFFKLKQLSKNQIKSRSSRNASIGGARFATQKKLKGFS